ncbi:MAG: hypothetical protein M0P31_05335 [Solirubrobacteraceae bacterium]|nr:hypothetical protein [Solirubrobacteraceae bacterium]
MSNLQRRSGNRLSRTQRVDRIYKLGLTSAGGAVALVVGLVIGAGWLIALGLLALVGGGFLLRNTMR